MIMVPYVLLLVSHNYDYYYYYQGTSIQLYMNEKPQLSPSQMMQVLRVAYNLIIVDSV